MIASSGTLESSECDSEWELSGGPGLWGGMGATLESESESSEEDEDAFRSGFESLLPDPPTLESDVVPDSSLDCDESIVDSVARTVSTCLGAFGENLTPLRAGCVAVAE